MTDIKKLIESMDKIEFANPKQKPGDQVRGTDNPPFKGRLVGSDESVEEAGKFLGEPYIRDEEDEESDLYSGCYVRDEQNDGSRGEIFKMLGDPGERRVRIEDKNGRGWYISPSRLTKVDDNDPEIKEYFRSEDEMGEYGFGRKTVKEAKPITAIAKLKKANADGAISADQISKDKEGNFIFRNGYYYRHGMDAAQYADRVDSQLDKLDINHTIVDKGDHWAPFKGGAGIKQNSHWWVKVRITETASEVSQIDEVDMLNLERNRALAGAKVGNRADPEKMAIWWSHYRRAISRGQNDKQSRQYAVSMTKTEPKYQDNPFIAKESIEDITEELKAAFEDYVKNKAEPEEAKERITITYRDGHTQTKLVTQKEKSKYKTSPSVLRIKPSADSKGRIDDAKLDEVFGQPEPDKYNKKGELEYIKRLKKQACKKPTDKKKVTEGASTEEIANAIAYRIDRQKPELITQYGVEYLADAIDEVAEFHAGVEEIGTSDISAMVNQVVRNLERSINEGGTPYNSLTHDPRLVSKMNGLKLKLKKAKEAFTDSKDTADARNVDYFNRKIKNLERKHNVDAVSESIKSSSDKLLRMIENKDRIAGRDPNAWKQLSAKLSSISQKLGDVKTQLSSKNGEGKVEEDFPTNLAPAGTQPQLDPNTKQPQQPQAAAAPTPIAAQPQTTAQQRPVAPPAAGGATVKPNDGAPQPPTGGQVNAATTPIEQMKSLVQTLASDPAAAKALATKVGATLR